MGLLSKIEGQPKEDPKPEGEPVDLLSNEDKDKNKEKEKTARETLGKYFYDMSKLIFTAVVLKNIKEIIIWTQCYSQ